MNTTKTINNGVNLWTFSVQIFLTGTDLLLQLLCIVYIKSNRIDRTIFDNRAMLYIERIGKYCSIFLMGINIGVLEGGFTKPIMETFWIISTCVLTVVALILWLLCFYRFSKLWAYLLTAVTAVIFIMSGLLQVKTLLLTAGVVYLIGQLYVTNKYVKSKMQ